MKGNMNKKTHLTGLMHDSKWARIFALITSAVGDHTSKKSLAYPPR